MHFTMQSFIDLLEDESGQDIVEYALVAVFIGLGAVAGTKALANAVNGVFTTFATTLTSAI